MEKNKKELNPIVMILIVLAIVCFVAYGIYHFFIDNSHNGNDELSPTPTPVVTPTPEPTKEAIVDPKDDIDIEKVDMSTTLKGYTVKPSKIDTMDKNSEYNLLSHKVDIEFNNSNLTIKIINELNEEQTENDRKTIIKEINNVNKVYYSYDKDNNSLTLLIVKNENIYVFDFERERYIINELNGKEEKIINYSDADGMNLFKQYKNNNYENLYYNENCGIKTIFGQTNDGKYHYLDTEKEVINDEYYYYLNSEEYIKTNREYLIGGVSGKIKMVFPDYLNRGIGAYIDENNYLYRLSVKDNGELYWKKVSDSKVVKVNTNHIYLKDNTDVKVYAKAIA